MLAEMLGLEGKYVAGWCMIGFQRRGGPVSGFIRFDDERVKQRDKVYYPDCIIAAEPRQLKSPQIFAGLKPAGILILNTIHKPKERLHPNLELIGALDATGIALKEIGRPLVNSCLLGAFAATTNWLSMDSILSVLEARFKGKALSSSIKCAERGFKEVNVIKY